MRIVNCFGVLVVDSELLIARYRVIIKTSVATHLKVVQCREIYFTDVIIEAALNQAVDVERFGDNGDCAARYD